MARSKAIRTAQIHSPDPGADRDVPVAARAPRSEGRHDANMSAFFQSLEGALGQAAGGKVILFSSARPGEGKTMVVGEFASLLTHRACHRVAIVDAGPRHEMAARCGGLQTVPLERAILSLKGVKLAEIPRKPDTTGPNTDCLIATTTSRAADSPTALRDPHSWSLLKSAYDYVLIDMPSLAESPLALGCARYVDGVVLVIESGRTRWQIVRNAQEQFERAGASVLGAFLNKRVFHVPRSLYNRL